MSDSEHEHEEVTDLSNQEVTTKYRTCGEISQKALQKVIEACVPDADLTDLCELGDSIINEATGKLYNKKTKDGKKIEKGVALPTSITVNEFMGYHSPLKQESQKLKAGDVCKIDLAVHIDGYITGAAHTLVVGGEKVEDRRADAITAAYLCAEAALRQVQVGNSNLPITETFGKICDDFKCKPVQGVRSHQLKKHVIHGNKSILGVETQDEKNEEFTFEANEVYSIDVMVSTGEGKGKETELRTTVFKRALDQTYILKTQKARQFISEVNKRFPSLPFSIRAFEDEQVARIGISEARRHSLLEEYPVLKEKEGEFTAQFKFTVLLLPGGSKKITGFPIDLEKDVKSSLSVSDEEIKKLLATSATTTSKKKAKKKTAKDDKTEEAEEK